MTVNNLFDKVVALLGYSGENGEKSGLKVLESRAVTAVNSILSDLSVKADIKSMDEAVPIDPSAQDALIYGTAMLLALSICDSEKSHLFTELYNLKRTGYKSEITKRADVVPTDNGGAYL